MHHRVVHYAINLELVGSSAICVQDDALALQGLDREKIKALREIVTGSGHSAPA